MQILIAELRHALRALRKKPAVPLIAVVTLALGIAVNVAIFSVVSSVLLRPLPYHDPERLMILWETSPLVPQESVSFTDWSDWRRQQHAFIDRRSAPARAWSSAWWCGRASRSPPPASSSGSARRRRWHG